MVNSAQGEAYCWGKNGYGALGGALNSSLIPQKINLKNIRGVIAGDNFSCFLTNKNVECIGNNQSGELGAKYGESPYSQVFITVAGIPAADSIVSMAANNRGACVLSKNGDLWYWGAWSGRSGDSKESPERIANVPEGIQVTLGGEHACILKKEGTVWCLGFHKSSQFESNNRYESKPIQVKGISNASFISSGGDAICALVNGHPLCWGQSIAKISTGKHKEASLVPTKIPLLDESVVYRTISVQESHACMTTDEGAVDCFGRNGVHWGNEEYSYLGNNKIFSETDNPQTVAGITNALEVVTGANFGACVLSANNKVSCWGNNKFGMLGNGNTLHSLAPVEVQWH